ncbi:MAG: hypothetical protein KJT03_05470, partial [Verrucomicrobiae bacterium]|nr:hypothetical protein [Verrucomicrobiae bacterium]
LIVSLKDIVQASIIGRATRSFIITAAFGYEAGRLARLTAEQDPVMLLKAFFETSETSRSIDEEQSCTFRQFEYDFARTLMQVLLSGDE